MDSIDMLKYTEEELTQIDRVGEDASMTLASAEEYFDGVAYRLEPTGDESAVLKQLIAEVYDDEGAPIRKFKIDFIITPL